MPSTYVNQAPAFYGTNHGYGYGRFNEYQGHSWDAEHGNATDAFHQRHRRTFDKALPPADAKRYSKYDPRSEKYAPEYYPGEVVRQTAHYENTNSLGGFGSAWWLRIIGAGLLFLAASNALQHDNKKARK